MNNLRLFPPASSVIAVVLHRTPPAFEMYCPSPSLAARGWAVVAPPQLLISISEAKGQHRIFSGAAARVALHGTRSAWHGPTCPQPSDDQN